MKEFAQFDNNFTSTKVSSYTLLLQADEKGIAYSIADTIRKTYLAQIRKFYANGNNLVEKIINTINNETFLAKKFKSINFILYSKKFTLIPQEFFDKKLVRDIFEKNHNLDSQEEVHFNSLKNNIFNLFSLPSDLIVYLVEKFPEINFFNQNSILINYALSYDKIIFNLTENLLDAIIVKNKNLIFANTFEVENQTDALYFVIKILKENNINQQTQIELTGDFENSIIKDLNSYYPNAKTFSNYYYNYKLDIPKQYLAVLNMSVYV